MDLLLSMSWSIARVRRVAWSRDLHVFVFCHQLGRWCARCHLLSPNNLAVIGQRVFHHLHCRLVRHRYCRLLDHLAKGTVSYGRKWGWHCVLFGIFDGLAESQLFLCIWSAVELIGLPRYGTGLVTFVLQGGFKANWDQRYWNVYVAPAHNIKEWNKWKVLLVHIPNVLVTFSYFITYGNATLYCATQTLALIGSTSFMCFPSPSSSIQTHRFDHKWFIALTKDNALLWRVDHWEATGRA